MTPTKYEDLLKLVAPQLKKSSLCRKAIWASERLTVTLKYIFSGSSQIDLSGMFRISKTCISRIVNETCEVLWNVLLDKNLFLTLKIERNGKRFHGV